MKISVFIFAFFAKQLNKPKKRKILTLAPRSFCMLWADVGGGGKLSLGFTSGSMFTTKHNCTENITDCKLYLY